MKKSIISFISVFIFCMPSSKADLFGGDTIVLTKILSNAIQQLLQLRQVVNSTRDNLYLLRNINRGINDSLNLISTIPRTRSPGLYGNLEHLNEALRAVDSIYGSITNSKFKNQQQHTDRGIAEAITLNNSIYKYSKEIDEIGERIKSFSHRVSPGGAQKLTAQSLGVILHVLNQSMRSQATGLKLQAQALALKNSKEKETTKHQLESADHLASAIKKQESKFQFPRF